MSPTPGSKSELKFHLFRPSLATGISVWQEALGSPNSRALWKFEFGKAVLGVPAFPKG